MVTYLRQNLKENVMRAAAVRWLLVCYFIKFSYSIGILKVKQKYYKFIFKKIFLLFLTIYKRSSIIVLIR